MGSNSLILFFIEFKGKMPAITELNKSFIEFFFHIHYLVSRLCL